MIALGIDPGLRSTGLALAQDRGPGLPTLLACATVRRPALELAVRVFETPTPNRADMMLDAILRRLVDLAPACDVTAIETFEDRPWQGRRVNTSPEMGRLVGRLHERLTGLSHRVIEVAPRISQAGYPRSERVRARLLPAGLRNAHERDAFLAAAAGLALIRRDPSVRRTERSGE